MMNMRFRALLFTLVAGLAFAGPVGAVDTTLSNARLLLSYDGADERERLSFRASGGSYLLPGADLAGDRLAGSGTLEIITREGRDFTFLDFRINAGGDWRRTLSGGWQFRGGKRDKVRRISISPKRITIMLQEGARAATGQAGFVGMRFEVHVLGGASWRVCARFSGDEILRDSEGRLLARHLRSSDLANCDDAELYGACEELSAGEGDCRGSCGEGQCGYDAAQGCQCSNPGLPCGDIPYEEYHCVGSCGEGGSCEADDWDEECRCVDATMPCGETAPVCGGTCPEGKLCRQSPNNGHILYPPSCECYRPGATSGSTCGASDFPTCGGECFDDDVCRPVTSPPGNSEACVCHDPNASCGDSAYACPPGSYCYHGGTWFFMCVPDCFPACGYPPW